MTFNYFFSFAIGLISWINQNNVPVFKGGSRAMESFINRSMIYPEYAKFNCLQGTVHVSFKLDRKGRIVHSKIDRGTGVDLDDEALRIVRLTSRQWTVPASFDTTQYLTVPINFSLKDYPCADRTKEELRSAVAAYKAHKDLTNVITNFYRSKYQGKADADDEARILALKERLGYTEKFISQTIRQAQLKLKQGDRESACEDLQFIHSLGSDKADKLIETNCK